MFRMFLSIVLLAVAAPLAQAQFWGGRRAPLAPETVVRAQDTLRMLGFELTMIERETLPGIKDPGFREALRGHVNRLQGSAWTLDRSLLPGGRTFLIHKQYAQVDRDLHELIDVIERSPLRTLALAQSGRRLAYLDTHLGALFAAHDHEGGGDTFPVALRRQAEALEASADDLFDLARASLPADPQSARVRENIRKFRMQSGVFVDRFDAGEGIPGLRKGYFSVDNAWQRVAWDINSLPPGQAQRVQFAAQRVDHLHGQIADMLKMGDAGQYLIREGDDQARNNLAILQGTWVMASYHANGKLRSGADPNNKLIFAGNRWFRQEGGAPGASGTFRVVEVGKGAVRIELDPASGPPVPALIQVDGNRLHYAHFLNRRAFPTTFQSAPGDDMLSITWQRE